MYLDSKLTKNDRENSLHLDIHTRWMQRKDFLLKNLNPRKLLFSWPKSYLSYKGKSGNQEVSGCDVWVEKIRLLPLRYWFFALMASQGQFLTKMKEKKIHYFLKSKGIFPHLIKLLNDFCSYFFLATVCTFPNIIVFKNVLPFLDSASCCKNNCYSQQSQTAMHFNFWPYFLFQNMVWQVYQTGAKAKSTTVGAEFLHLQRITTSHSLWSNRWGLFGI